MSPPHAAAGVGAGVYVAGAGLVAGAVYLMTPAGQRMSESLGDAVIQGGSNAVDNIRNLISSDDDAAPTTAPTTATDTDTGTRRCDGPHGGRFQAQGYRSSAEPRPVELSQPWNFPCQAPLRAVGLGLISALFAQTATYSYRGAGLRGGCFAKMSQHVTSAPPSGFLAGHRAGWGVTVTGAVVRSLSAGPNAPRVDLEVHRGRAFGTM